MDTYAGKGVAAEADGTLSSANFYSPIGVMTTSDAIFTVDFAIGTIRKLSSSGSVTTFAGGANGVAVDGLGTRASFNNPNYLDMDTNGNIYIADTGNHLIRKIDTSAMVTTLAGSSIGYADGSSASAKFKSPMSASVDSNGNVYVADNQNCLIRLINPAGTTTTFAGTGSTSSCTSSTDVYFPRSTFIEKTGTLYFTDMCHQVRMKSGSGTITTLAGYATTAMALVDGQGTLANFYGPTGLQVDSSGTVYVADYYAIRRISSSGYVTTVAGSGVAGTVDGVGTSARFQQVFGIAVKTNGDILVADQVNNVVKIVYYPRCGAGFYNSSGSCLSVPMGTINPHCDP